MVFVKPKWVQTIARFMRWVFWINVFKFDQTWKTKTARNSKIKKPYASLGRKIPFSCDSISWPCQEWRHPPTNPEMFLFLQKWFHVNLLQTCTWFKLVHVKVLESLACKHLYVVYVLTAICQICSCVFGVRNAGQVRRIWVSVLSWGRTQVDAFLTFFSSIQVMLWSALKILSKICTEKVFLHTSRNYWQ